MQRGHWLNISGLIDADPAAKYWRRTCEVLCNPRSQWFQLFKADGIISNFLAIIANTDLKILKTIPWKYAVYKYVSTVCI